MAQDDRGDAGATGVGGADDRTRSGAGAGSGTAGSGTAGSARPPGLKDVAEVAGVSWKTVSNVVNGTGRVGDATRARVEQAVADLGYRPSLAGRQLRQGRTRTLALAVPQVDTPYFGGLAHAVIEAARPRGYTVVIDETGADPAAERVVARGFAVRLIDGIVFSPLGLPIAEVDELRGSTPMVLLGERDAALRNGPVRTDHVSIDNVRAAHEATTHLLEQGRHRLAFLGVEPDSPPRSGALRLQGFREAVEAAGVAVPERWLLPQPRYTRRSGARTIEQVLPRIGEVDGLLCANDELALGAMWALRTNGVRVPQDVAVVGWDNIEDGQFANPSLTTVAPDVAAIAEHAVDRVIAQIERRSPGPEDVTVSHRLLVRESSRA